MSRSPEPYPEIAQVDYTRTNLRWNGWGARGHDFPGLAYLPEIMNFMGAQLGLSSRPATPSLPIEKIRLPRTKLKAGDLTELRKIVGAQRVQTGMFERIFHSSGRSYVDVMRLRTNRLSAVVDAAVYPGSEREVVRLIAWAARKKVALVPFGGGSSVVGGVEPIRGRNHKAVVSLDMTRMAALEELNTENQTATFQAGIYGPQLEAELNQAGYTLGHFPQSFEYSTLGGWVAARSAGQQSGRYGKIEELLCGLRCVSPGGTLDVHAFPAAATGPDLGQVIAGSEGLLGVITSVTVKVRPLPPERLYFGLMLPNFHAAVRLIRAIAQAGLPVAMARLSDRRETELLEFYGGLRKAGTWQGRLQGLLVSNYLRLFGIGRERCMIVVGIEGARAANRRTAVAVRALASAEGGVYLGRGAGNSWLKGRFRMPLLRDHLLDEGMGVDTFETAVPFDRVHEVHEGVLAAVEEVLPGSAAMCHISHSYHNGACLYFTVIFAQDGGNPVTQWRRFKRAASDAVVRCGGNISHHHGVGTDHKQWYVKQTGRLALGGLRAWKARVDPTGILNPGKLFFEDKS